MEEIKETTAEEIIKIYGYNSPKGSQDPDEEILLELDDELPLSEEYSGGIEKVAIGLNEEEEGK